MPFLAGRGQASRGYFGGGSTPDAPTSLSSTPGNQQLTIGFTPPVFNGGLDITNYEYSINAGSTWTAFSPVDITSPVVITGLTNGTAYTVYLRAVNSLGGGQSSSALSSNTTPRTVPSITLNSATNFNQNRATLNATVTSNGGSAITSVSFQYYKGGDGWTSATGIDAGSNNWYANITSLAEGTVYTFRVNATNAAGTTTTSTSTFTTWSLKPAFTSTSNSSLTIPTITPTGGTRINPSIYEVVIFGGGGTRGTYGAAGGGAAYKSDASVEVTQASGVVSWTIGGTGGGTTTVSGLSVAYSAAGGGNGSSDTPIGPSAFPGGPPWDAMTSGGSGGSGNSNAAGAGRYYAEDKVEKYAYGGGGGSGAAGGDAIDGVATNPAIGGDGGSGNSIYGIEGGGGGGGSGYDTNGTPNGSNGSYRTYGGGESGTGASAATAGVIRFKYYGA
jgi:hypothetical protein